MDDQTTNTHVGTVPTIQTPTKDEVSENRGIWGKGNIRRYLMAILCGIPFVLAVTYRQNQLVLNTSWDKEAVRIIACSTYPTWVRYKFRIMNRRSDGQTTSVIGPLH